MTTAKETLRSEFHDPEARHDYADIFLSSSIALQIKALRLQRGWSQETLAEKAGMKQSRISAMEQASYTGWSLSTLRRLAKAFDLALEVRFESFGTLLNDATSVSRNALERPSFSDDIAFKPLEQRAEKAEPDPL
jgi:transcriptional regulator with XRE-family HTH domain